MPAPYSYDLRTKAIEAVQRGERKSGVCGMLKIRCNSLDLWLKREEETGDYRPITGFQKGAGHKLRDWQRFREFAKQHGGKTQSEMTRL